MDGLVKRGRGPVAGWADAELHSNVAVTSCTGSRFPMSLPEALPVKPSHMRVIFMISTLAASATWGGRGATSACSLAWLTLWLPGGCVITR